MTNIKTLPKNPVAKADYGKKGWTAVSVFKNSNDDYCSVKLDIFVFDSRYDKERTTACDFESIYKAVEEMLQEIEAQISPTHKTIFDLLKENTLETLKMNFL